MNKDTVIVGYSGHAYVVIEAVFKSNRKVYGYAMINKAIRNPYKLIYLGSEVEESFNGWDKDYSFVLGIGDNRLRQKVYRFIKHKGEKISNVIHPSAEISVTSSIGDGSFISSGAILNAQSIIGEACIINTGAIIEHECVISDFSHVAPGAVLAGNVNVGRRTFIGANAVIKEGLNIGDDVVIGAGTVVLKDVESNKTLVGNPSRLI